MMTHLTIPCPKCQKLFPAKILSTRRMLHGERHRCVQAECDEHGMLNDIRSDQAFETNANLKLSARRTVACPRCGRECTATVLDERNAMAGRLRILEGECPVDGRFQGTQFSPSATAAG
jgi:endogenous inhibitor of DNA gyrase (YacG/DUF329 family)